MAALHVRVIVMIVTFFNALNESNLSLILCKGSTCFAWNHVVYTLILCCVYYEFTMSDAWPDFCIRDTAPTIIY